MSDNDQLYQYPEEEFIDKDAAALEAESVSAKVSAQDDNSLQQKMAALVQKIPPDVLSFLLSKKFKVIAVIVSVLAIGAPFASKMYSHFSAPSKSASMQVQVTKTTVAPKVDSIASQTEKHALLAINHQVAQQSHVPLVQQQALEQQAASMKLQIKELKDEVNQLKQSRQAVNTAGDSYQVKMLNMMSQIAKQQHEVLVSSQKEQVKQLSKSASKELLAALRKQIQPVAVYHVQGIVPGLAWLVDEQGHTKTIRQGVKLAGYGTVVAIDPAHGVVQTSSGKMIQEPA